MQRAANQRKTYDAMTDLTIR